MHLVSSAPGLLSALVLVCSFAHPRLLCPRLLPGCIVRWAARGAPFRLVHVSFCLRVLLTLPAPPPPLSQPSSAFLVGYVGPDSRPKKKQKKRYGIGRSGPSAAGARGAVSATSTTTTTTQTFDVVKKSDMRLGVIFCPQAASTGPGTFKKRPRTNNRPRSR